MLELWFDFSCPYAYLASQQASRFAAAGVEIDWRPMLLGGVFRGIGAGDGPMATLSPAKARHNAADMVRWAELIGAPFQMPAAHPMRTVRALRVLLGLPTREWPAAIHALYAAYWQRGENVADDAVIRAALAGAGIESSAAFATADSDAIKDELRARTDEAIALGIFGAPAWVLRREGAAPLLCWGQDRIEWTLAALAGWDPDAQVPPDGPRTITADPARPGATLDVYFDVSSPFAYLGLTQLPALARAAGVVPRLHPILLGALFKGIDQANVPWFAMSPPKQRYVGLEMTRWARWWGQPFQLGKFPQRTVNAQRLAILAADQSFDDGIRLALALARAMWAESRDLEDPATLAAILDENGFPRAWLERTSDPELKARLADNTARAQAREVFGVPTFVVNDRYLFWGQDRLELVAKTLAGWEPSC